MSLYETAIRNAELYGHSVARDLVVFGTLGSTMDVADRMIREGTARPGVTILALDQTAAKGRAGSRWQSLAGNVMFNRIVDISAHEYGQEIEMIAACAVAEVVQSLLPLRPVSLKYPNGVRVGPAKISGALVWPFYDAVGRAGSVRLVSVGVGVNLKTAPSNLSQMTTSLAQEGRTETISGFIEKFDLKFCEILNEYRKCSDFDVVLERMEFLSRDGLITLQERDSPYEITGTYRGFCVDGSGMNAVPYIRILTRRGMEEIPVRNLEIVSQSPPRSAPGLKPAHRFWYAPR